MDTIQSTGLSSLQFVATGCARLWIRQVDLPASREMSLMLAIQYPASQNWIEEVV
jgi:hypothetical protein